MAAKLVAYVMSLGLLAVAVDGLARRALGAKAPPLSVALPRAFVAIAVGLGVFAVALYFDPHTWLVLGIPIAAMVLVHRGLRRRADARTAASEEQGGETTATAPATTEPPVAVPAGPDKPSAAYTLACIAVAVAVAFAVRHIVLEAFSVPLSALEPTILGRHFNVACDRCGGRFTEMELGLQPPAAMPCPGCGGPARIDGGLKTQDRILVEKLSEPSRWDLAVFKQADPDPEAAKKLVTRIVGMPGESVELGMGDVFINGQRLVKPADRVEQLWFPVGDTEWGGAGKPLNGWVSETDEGGPLLRYAHPVTALLLTGVDEREPAVHVEPRPVRDVRLVADLAAQHAGQLELSWSVEGQHAAVKVDPAKSVVLLVVGDQTRSTGAAAKKSVGLAVRDGVVSALADGRVVGTCPLESQAAADHVERARLAAKPCALVVRAATAPRRIRVWRDVHYFTEGAEPVVRARLGEPFKLEDNSYFVLGDNSGLAGDSRTFTSVAPEHQGHCQPGAVSRQMFVGVARWVYWPIQRAYGKRDGR